MGSLAFDYLVEKLISKTKLLFISIPILKNAIDRICNFLVFAAGYFQEVITELRFYWSL